MGSNNTLRAQYLITGTVGKVKHPLMKASILHYFDQNKPFKLTADVSQSELGAALLQHKT